MKDPGSFVAGCVCIVIALALIGVAFDVFRGIIAWQVLLGIGAAISLIIGVVLVKGGFE
jgi:multidrug transporter EmrE-like cation transporter